MPPFLHYLPRLVVPSPPQLLRFPISTFTTSAKIMAQEYQIKGLSKLDLKKGEKREVEVEGIENGKVLLANVNGKTHAMSSKCTVCPLSVYPSISDVSTHLNSYSITGHR